MVYLEVCKFEKKIRPVGKYFFGEYHRLEYHDRYVVCKFEGRGIDAYGLRQKATLQKKRRRQYQKNEQWKTCPLSESCMKLLT